MAIKVLVINDYGDGGSVYAARPDAEIFVGLAELGVEVHIMTAGESHFTRRFRQKGIHLINFSPNRKFSQHHIRRIREQLVAEEYDILHLFYSASIINGIRAARGLPVKVVLYRGFSGHIHWYDPSAYLKYLHPRVDMIMCNSRATAEQIRKQLLFPREKTVVISKGHDVRWYDDVVPARIREERGIPDDALLIVHVSNYRKVKGVEYLLQAFNMLPPGLPVHLILVGANQDNAHNLKLIQTGAYAEHVHILGFKRDPLDLVAACDVFVLASVKGEAITRALIEAMSMRLAPIITDIPGNRGVVEHEKNGLLVQPKSPGQIRDAILYMIQNREACREMGKQARAHIETHLSNAEAVRKVKEMYERLATGRAVTDEG